MFNPLKQLAGKKVIKIILIVFGALIIFLAIFTAGMAVGFRKAMFSYQWGENYHRLFGGPRKGWGGDMRGSDFISSNSVVGSVIKFASGTLYVKGLDNVERSVLITSSTTMQSGRSSIKASELKADDKIIILGVPSSTGQIEAKLIRIMPSLSAGKK
jgi:uncharacterized membrane protein